MDRALAIAEVGVQGLVTNHKWGRESKEVSR
jgi:hypothetical protein